jgi:demethylmenaquinone methyltransferase/2-methoxy-6-polyprenyl-1,4-benzoquinol methylase
VVVRYDFLGIAGECVALRSAACVCDVRIGKNIKMAETDTKVADVRVTGTLPEGAVSEADASRKVRDMFAHIAPRYDLLNHLLSLQLDRWWRARAARRLAHILHRDDAVVLDLCCGTGDLALALARPGKARVIGADFAHPMLVRAVEKSALHVRDNGGRLIPFLEADALGLPFAGAAFDLVTTAFGFRNLANYETGLREIYRVLKPGGTVAILEFTEPPDHFIGDVYRWYFCNVLPRIGRLLSGDADAYKYLPKSVSLFMRPVPLSALMATVGYTSVEFTTYTFCTVCLHLGKKPTA